MLGMAGAGSDLEDREGDLSRRCNTSLVVAWCVHTLSNARACRVSLVVCDVRLVVAR